MTEVPLFSVIPILLAALFALQAPDQPLPSLRHADVTVAASSERPTIVIVVAAKRLRLTKAWEIAIREELDDIEMVRIADLEPGVDLDEVRSKLKRRIPDEIDLLLDPKSSWATTLELDASQPNLLLLLPDGSVQLLARGRYSPERLDQLLAALPVNEQE
jgi:hypothetical protein